MLVASVFFAVFYLFVVLLSCCVRCSCFMCVWSVVSYVFLFHHDHCQYIPFVIVFVFAFIPICWVFASFVTEPVVRGKLIGNRKTNFDVSIKR